MKRLENKIVVMAMGKKVFETIWKGDASSLQPGTRLAIPGYKEVAVSMLLHEFDVATVFGKQVHRITLFIDAAL
jgi:hypothetical protein